MDTNFELAELLFPDIKKTTSDYENLYPPRELPTTSMVTRFAPSPTGFMHIGGISTALISKTLAKQTNGIFFLRIEDTDKKREIENGVYEIITNLQNFNITPDEGFIAPEKTVGCYGPYKQSQRIPIYKTYIKELIKLGFAYPCFCSPEELAISRQQQIEQKIRPGYYGQWAHHRKFSLEEIKRELDQHRPFAIRLRAPEPNRKKIFFSDLIKGNIEFPVNDIDVVLLKSDNLPTYHFAHFVDDYLMRVTHVIRGDEWLSSLPIHLQLFQYFKKQPPYYAHVAPIAKIEGNSKRKLSKRKDPEAAVSYYYEKGYPSNGVIEYLLNLANSNFYSWRVENPTEPLEKFSFSFKNMGSSSAMFDISKLDNICKNVISTMEIKSIYDQIVKWALAHDLPFAKIIQKNKSYTLQILDIENTEQKKRKDIACWSAIKENLGFFYDEIFDEIPKELFPYPLNIGKADIRHVLSFFIDQSEIQEPKDNWLIKVRLFFDTLGYAQNIKILKLNPNKYKGAFGDLFMIIRVALTSKTQTPDLYEMLKIMGANRVKKRLTFAKKNDFVNIIKSSQY